MPGSSGQGQALRLRPVRRASPSNRPGGKKETPMSGTTPSVRLTRAKIVAAVSELLERGGVDAGSTRTGGEALTVHPTALYRHFRDMDELLREAADGILAGLAD